MIVRSVLFAAASLIYTPSPYKANIVARLCIGHHGCLIVQPCTIDDQLHTWPQWPHLSELLGPGFQTRRTGRQSNHTTSTCMAKVARIITIRSPITWPDDAQPRTLQLNNAADVPRYKGQASDLSHVDTTTHPQVLTMEIL